MDNYLIKFVISAIIAFFGLGCVTSPASHQPNLTIDGSPMHATLSSTDMSSSEPIEGTEFGFIAPTTTITSPTASSNTVLFIDANQSVNPFSNEMLGVALSNWEHSWGKFFPGEVPGLADSLKAADIGLIRYAGGLWANWVGWERLPQRTPYEGWIPDPANYHPDFQAGIDALDYAFHYGQDEIDSLARLSQESGAAIMVQMNVSNNDPEMWADMAHYTNIEKEYGFKYWELGNEFDLECRDDSEVCVDPETYKTRAENYIAALQNVDNDLIVVGGVPASGHAFFGANDYSGATTEMSPWLYQARAAGVNSLSYHWYSDCNLSSLDNVLTYTWEVPYNAWQNSYSRQWSKIAPERVETEVIEPGEMNLTQGITELNIDACNFERAPINSNHINAVWMADVIGRLGYNGLDYVTWYTGYGSQQQGYPAIATEEDFYEWGGGPIYLRPSYYTLFLYGNFFGDHYVYSANTDEGTLSLWASTDSEEPDTLKLIVVNISDTPVDEPIIIDGFIPLSGKKYILQNDDPLSLSDSSNAPDHGTTINSMTLTPDNILGAVSELESNAPTVTIIDGHVVEEIPPFSVMAIVLEGEFTPPLSRLWLPFLGATLR